MPAAGRWSRTRSRKGTRRAAGDVPTVPEQDTQQNQKTARELHSEIEYSGQADGPDHREHHTDRVGNVGQVTVHHAPGDNAPRSRICPSAWLLTRMLLAAALEQSAGAGMARPTISGRRAMRVRRPISSASTICHWRASISPPQKAAAPTMAKQPSEGLQLHEDPFRVGRLSARRWWGGRRRGCPLPGKRPLSAWRLWVRPSSGDESRGELCRMNQHEQTAARTNRRTQPRTLPRRDGTAGFDCFLTMIRERYFSGRARIASGCGQKGLLFHGEVFTIEDLYLLLAGRPGREGHRDYGQP